MAGLKSMSVPRGAFDAMLSGEAAGDFGALVDLFLFDAVRRCFGEGGGVVRIGVREEEVAVATGLGDGCAGVVGEGPEQRPWSMVVLRLNEAPGRSRTEVKPRCRWLMAAREATRVM